MTEEQFDRGYWYVDELKAFARELGLSGTSRLRKDELEGAIKAFFRTGVIAHSSRQAISIAEVRDIDLGLRLDLPVVNYVSNRATKDFILQEALKIDPAFRRKPGTRYLLNRWREEQLRKGIPITYGDLVRQAMRLNQAKEGPLRIEHGRYINFLSDFMAANQGATKQQALAAWEEVKQLDIPKTYQAWTQHRKA